MHKVKRLFVTTGLISLVHALAIREQKSISGYADVEDVIVIYSTKEDFFARHNSIGRAFGIDQIYPTSDFRLYRLANHHPLETFDELYTLSHFFIIPPSIDQFSKARLFLYDEGLSSYVDYFHGRYSDRIEKAYFPLYNDRIDFLNNKSIQIEKIEKKVIKSIFNQIASDNPLCLPFAEEDKVILFLGQYLFNVLGEEKLLNMHYKVLSQLVSLGYRVLFKYHPREGINFKNAIEKRFNKTDIVFFDNALPAEVYDFNVVAAVSFSSGSLLTLSHLYDIPAFHIKCADELSDDRIQTYDRLYYKIVEEYTPEITKLFSLGSVRSVEKNICREKLKEEYDSRIISLPLLSQNTSFSEELEETLEYTDFLISSKTRDMDYVTKQKMDNLFVQLKITQVPKLSQIRLETSTQCEYRCFMCPRHKLTRRTGRMTFADLECIIDRLSDINYELDVHMHGFGETLVNEDFPKRVRLITSRKPNFTPLIFSTLGYNMDPVWFESLFSNGLRKVVVSFYGYDEESYESAHGVNRFEIAKKNLETLISWRHKYALNIRVLLDGFGSMHPSKKSEIERIKLRDNFANHLLAISCNEIEIATPALHNFGSGFSEFTSHEKTVPCSVCWGHRMSHLYISWDLNVFPCAYDYDGNIVWGNLRKQTLEEIYDSPERISFIKKLIRGIRHPMCEGCFPNETGGYESEYAVIAQCMGAK